MLELNEIEVIPKQGHEVFYLDNQEKDFSIKDFWSWAQSNLIENRTRGILAEFIIKKALNINSKTRIEWDDFDLITNKGNKIEVKSAAYIQSWKQHKFSNISFDIQQKKDRSNGKINRQSDYYIFCLLHHKIQETLNPLDLRQWIFYVLETKIISEIKGEQKRIGLNPLLKLNPLICDFKQLTTLNL